MTDLTTADTHFSFGKNWAQFADKIDRTAVEHARAELSRLLGKAKLDGLSFLDIGSGSGIHSLAALELGASTVKAVDIDEVAVETTKASLSRYAPSGSWTAEVRSIFDLTPENFGKFDIVYSWGVLHHTGAMNQAISKAAALVADGGMLCIAIYGRTMLCGFWRLEKRLYSRAPKWTQMGIRGLYIGLLVTLSTIRNAFRGRLFRLKDHIRHYSKSRGMEFYTDVHDWLGGFPYESATATEVRAMVLPLGFTETRSFIQPGIRHGLLGSGCDEYVFARQLGKSELR